VWEEFLQGRPQFSMKRFIEGVDRTQSVLFPAQLDEYIDEDNAVRVIDVFVNSLNLKALGFDGTVPANTGRPAYHPSVLLNLYIYGYLNRIQSSRRLEREGQRNIELMWLLNRLVPDFKTIAGFRKDNAKAIGNVCRQFVLLCHKLDMFEDGEVAIDGSKFKAVNTETRTTHSVRLQHVSSKLKRALPGTWKNWSEPTASQS
jgi:transposase